MATFTIDSENNITAQPGPPASAHKSQSFSNAKELAKLTAEWPASRLIDTWNSFAGVAPFDDLKPVKKFTNRKAAVARIWKAVQRLSRYCATADARANGEDPIEGVPGQGFTCRTCAKQRHRIAH